MMPGYTLELFFERFIKVKGVPTHRLPSKKNYKPGTLNCCFCDTVLWTYNYTKEHLWPQCMYGNNSVYNVKPCCQACNKEKGAHNIEQYIFWLRSKRLNWKAVNAEKAFYGNDYNLL